MWGLPDGHHRNYALSDINLYLNVSNQENRMKYTIEEHKHRYAAWAASRASSVTGCRFSVSQGKSLIEKIKIDSFVDAPDVRVG